MNCNQDGMPCDWTGLGFEKELRKYFSEDEVKQDMLGIGMLGDFIWDCCKEIQAKNGRQSLAPNQDQYHKYARK